MGNRKQPYKPKSFESSGRSPTGKADTSANIYESMIRSEAFQAMNKAQRLLYVCCKGRLYGHRKPKADYPADVRLRDDTCFYYSLKDAVDDGLYTKNGCKEFYKDMKVLEDMGFIVLLASGKSTHTRSIYRFSDEWQTKTV